MKRFWTVILFSTLFLVVSAVSRGVSEGANANTRTEPPAGLETDYFNPRIEPSAGAETENLNPRIAFSTNAETTNINLRTEYLPDAKTVSSNSIADSSVNAAEGAENTVIRPGDDIQAALNDLRDGGRLMLSEGDYGIDSSLEISGKSGIIIAGEGRVNIIGSRVDFPILLIENCSDVILQNIHAVHKNDAKLDNAQFEKPDGSVAYLKSCRNVAFNECELEGCGVYGIYAVDTDVIDVNGCYLHHNSWRAIGIVNRNTRTLITIRDSNITQNTGFTEYSEKSCTVNLQGDNHISDNTPEAYENSR